MAVFFLRTFQLLNLFFTISASPLMSRGNSLLNKNYIHSPSNHILFLSSLHLFILILFPFPMCFSNVFYVLSYNIKSSVYENNVLQHIFYNTLYFISQTVLYVFFF
uniref:NADH dehydrogenase subunit 4 n=1 Tax=Cacopsylla melanoneura TaxID=428564 RepID=A0A8D8ZC77_9HEMI